MIQLSTNLSDPLMDLIHTNAIQEEDCHLLQWILERSHAQVLRWRIFAIANWCGYNLNGEKFFTRIFFVFCSLFFSEQENGVLVIADRLLVERAKRGDQAALVEIYERCQPLVFTYVYYRVGGDQPCAEDLTSEVFVRMIDKLPGFQFQGKPLLAWLYTIARNLIIDRLRTNHQSRFPLAENLTADRTSHTAALAEAMLDHECLSRALEHLTDDQRQVILLKFVEDRSNAEIGKLLGKTEGAVKSLQHRALTALQRAIEQEQCYER